MAYSILRIEDFNYDPEVLAFIPPALALRRVDSSGRYNRLRPLPPDGGVFSTRIFTCGAMDIEEGWRLVIPGAYRCYRVGEELGLLELQIFDGSSWWFYNAATPAWEAVVTPAADWGSERDTLVNFASYPGRNSRTIQVRCRVLPDSAGRWAPKPSYMMLVWPVDLEFDPVEDLLRSVKRKIDSLAFPGRLKTILSSATDLVPFEHGFTPLASGRWRVYNLSVDPRRESDLFSAWVDPNVQLTAVQPAGSVIEVRFEGSVQTFLSADEEGYLSANPSVVVFQDGDGMLARDVSQAGHETVIEEAGLETFRNEHVAETEEIPVRIVAQSNRHKEALNILNRISAWFQKYPRVPSVGLGGEPVQLRSMLRPPINQANEIGRGLFMYTMLLRALPKQWNLSASDNGSDIEYAMKELHVTLGDPSAILHEVTLLTG